MRRWLRGCQLQDDPQQADEGVQTRHVLLESILQLNCVEHGRAPAAMPAIRIASVARSSGWLRSNAQLTIGVREPITAICDQAKAFAASNRNSAMQVSSRTEGGAGGGGASRAIAIGDPDR